MEDTQKAKHQADAEVGMIMRQFMNHPGFAIWNKDLEEKMNDTKKEWLTAKSPEDAERVRNRAIQLNLALDLVKRRVIAGDNARKLLELAKENDLELNQGLSQE